MCATKIDISSFLVEMSLHARSFYLVKTSFYFISIIRKPYKNYFEKCLCRFDSFSLYLIEYYNLMIFHICTFKVAIMVMVAQPMVQVMAVTEAIHKAQVVA